MEQNLLEKLLAVTLLVKDISACYRMKIHHHVHNSPPPLPIHRHMNPGQALVLDLIKIHSNIIITYTPRSFKWSLSFSRYQTNMYEFLISPTHAPPISKLI